MHKINVRMFSVLACIGALGAVYMIFARSSTSHLPLKAVLPVAPKSHDIVGIGVIEPKDKVLLLSFQNTGIVEKISMHTGQKVKQGDLLCALNLDDIECRIRILEATYKNALIQEKKIHEQATIAKDLHKNKVFSNHEARWNTYNAEQASAKREECAGHLQQAKVEREHHHLRAPMDGTILSCTVYAGQYISPGVTLCLMGNLKTLRVCVEFDAVYALHIKRTPKAIGRSKIEGAREISLKLTEIDPYVYPKRNLPEIHSGVDTRVIRAYYEVVSPDDLLWVGQELDVWIPAIPSVLQS
jgi:RND family efflux transporter MFP subunit